MDSVLEIFHPKMSNVRVDQMKLMMTKSKPQSNRIIMLLCEIEEMLKIPKSIIDRHIQRLGLVKKLDFWIPHEFNEIHLTKRINACDLHLKRNEFELFLKRIITADEKWIVYNNGDDPSVTNHHKQHRKLNYIKKRLIRMSTVVR